MMNDNISGNYTDGGDYFGKVLQIIAGHNVTAALVLLVIIQ